MSSFSALALMTACAAACVAFAAQSIAHELIGHGAACSVAGGRPLFVDSFFFRCTLQGRLVDAGGPAANIIFGLAAILALRRAQGFSPYAYFLWLLAAINLLSVTGYMLQSGVTDRGDWASVVDALPAPASWRAAMAISGIVLYYLTLRWLCRFMILAVDRGDVRRGDLRPLMFSAYLTCGLLGIASGALNPDGVFLRNAVAQSFLATIGLLLLPRIVERQTKEQEQAPPPRSSVAWIICGAIVASVFVFVLGPGIKL